METKPLVAELLPQNPILFLEVVDHVAVLLIHCAGDGDQQQSKWIEGQAHWDKVALHTNTKR